MIQGGGGGHDSSETITEENRHIVVSEDWNQGCSLLSMFLGTQRTIAFVSKSRGGCLCQGRRSLTWNRSSGSAGAGLAIHLKVLLVVEGAVLVAWEATSSRMAWTTEERLSRDGWRATRGKEVLEDYGRLTARSTAFWHQHQARHQSMSERVINHGIISRALSKASRLTRSLQRAVPLPVLQGKRKQNLARKMWKAAQRNLQRCRPEKGMAINEIEKSQILSCLIVTFQLMVNKWKQQLNKNRI